MNKDLIGFLIPFVVIVFGIDYAVGSPLLNTLLSFLSQNGF